MAINKNDFKNPEGNYEAKNSLVDALADGINTNEIAIGSLIQPVLYTETEGHVGSGERIYSLSSNGLYILFVAASTMLRAGVYLIHRQGTEKDDIFINPIITDGAITVEKHAGGKIRLYMSAWRRSILWRIM